MIDPRRVERVAVLAPGRAGWRRAAWREWCFVRAVAGRTLKRAIVLVAIVVAASWAYAWGTTPRGSMPLLRAVHDVWFLAFGNPVEAYPKDWLPRLIQFAMPLVGLVIIVETLVDIALVFRDRRLSERRWGAIMAASTRHHVILVGLGKLGFRTYQLLRKLGEEVVVIEMNGANSFLDEVRRDGGVPIVGDARREATLELANVKDAKAVLVATSDDLANLEVAFDAKRLNPRVRVVTRMFDQAMADKVSSVAGVDLAMSQSSISAPAFAIAAVDPGAEGSAIVGHSLVVTRRIGVGEFAGRTLGEAMERLRIAVLDRRDASGEATPFPPPSTILKPGDTLLVQGAYTGEGRG